GLSSQRLRSSFRRCDFGLKTGRWSGADRTSQLAGVACPEWGIASGVGESGDSGAAKTRLAGRDRRARPDLESGAESCGGVDRPSTREVFRTDRPAGAEGA